MAKHIELANKMAEFNPEWSTKRGARGHCYNASTRLEMALKEEGIAATMVAHRGGWHWAVLVGQATVIDLTFRQFDEDAEFPWITDIATWRAACRKHMH